MSTNEGAKLSAEALQAWALLEAYWNGTLTREEARSRLIERGGIPADIDVILDEESDLIDESAAENQPDPQPDAAL